MNISTKSHRASRRAVLAGLATILPAAAVSSRATAALLVDPLPALVEEWKALTAAWKAADKEGEAAEKLWAQRREIDQRILTAVPTSQRGAIAKVEWMAADAEEFASRMDCEVALNTLLQGMTSGALRSV